MSNIKLISSKVCIARAYDAFGIDYQEWEGRAPFWIGSAMREIKMPQMLFNTTEDATVEEYKCDLPANTQYIRGVSYDGYRIPRISRVNEATYSDMPERYHDAMKYDIDPRGYLFFTFEEADIQIHIAKFLTDDDKETGLCYPMVPDNEEVLKALDYYILLRIVQRGHNVPGYSLRDQNRYTNPAQLWASQIGKARNSLGAPTADQREMMSKLTRSLLINSDWYTDVDFNRNKVL